MKHKYLALPLAFLLISGATLHAQFDTIINVPPDLAPTSISSNTQLNLADGGTLPNDFLAGVNPINNANVEVNIVGGTVGAGFGANGGSRVDISGSAFVHNYFARGDSVTDISDGVFDGVFTARVNSEVNVRGGAFADKFTADSGAAINIFGGEMHLDGEPIAGLANVGDSLPFNLPKNAVLSGVLAHGTPFALTSRDLDQFQAGTITLHLADLPSVGLAQITASTDPIPLGIRTGQAINVDLGSQVGDHFNAGKGSDVLVNGGQIGKNFETLGRVVLNDGEIGVRFDATPGSTVEVAGGSVGNFAQAYNGSAIEISGGKVGAFFEAFTGSILNISGGILGGQGAVYSGGVVNLSDGILGRGFDANDGGVVNVTGGRIQPGFGANPGSTVNLTGGVVTGGFDALSQSTVNLAGVRVLDGFQARGGSSVNITAEDFLLDGEPIAGLIGEQPFLLTDRDATLTGKFANGEQFSLELSSSPVPGQDFFDAQANLTLLRLANANFDDVGFVNASDLPIWEAALGVNADADADFDGDSDGADFLWWQRRFTTPGAPGGSGSGVGLGAAPVPEPATATLLICATAALIAARRRSTRGAV